ncbi:hypothetical protein PENFLA_c001G05975 [Penicillium flavigenum]|uniref:RRM domain-containing protein n=1 Tax=Penicillium flavigenum TaxID=254877 RepID=A0A1V6U2E5_9EURO|nr:hypothetical protein PENFLA_c001G05975 [Penicillium flavigenum]
MPTKLLVTGLAWETTEDGLRDAFSEFGEVVGSIVMKDRETGRSRGFGFITFSSVEAASAATHALNERELDNRVIHIQPAPRR